VIINELYDLTRLRLFAVPRSSVASSVEYIRTGKLRGLAVTSAMRSGRISCRIWQPHARRRVGLRGI
jgi:hypothetical protein